MIMTNSSATVTKSAIAVTNNESYLNKGSAKFSSKSFGQVILLLFSSFSRKTNLIKGIFLLKYHAYK